MKKFLLSAVAILIAASSFAQTAEKAVKQYGFWDNWFIQFQGGVSENVSENYKRADVLKLLSPAAALSVGKYFSPEVGARLQVNGWQANNKYFTSKTNSNYYHTQFIGGNFDALFNLSNIFCKYNPKRVFNLVGIVGVGYEYGFKRDKDSDFPKDIDNTKSVSPRVGLAADFRLSDAWNFNVEANGNIDPDNFNGVVVGRKNEGRLNILLGFTYKFKNRGFKVLDAVDPSYLESLNSKINDQRQQIEDLQNQLKNQPKAAPAPAPQEAIKSIVLFKIGQSVIEENQKANLYNVAQYIKDNNKKVTVVGYADAKTGSAQRNQEISQSRAESVAKALQDYGVDSSLISTDAKGDTVQPFANNNDWNRVVIISQE
jgi:OOP family OmpA-OmpF porin